MTQKLQHILKAEQFDRNLLDRICNLTDAIRKFAKTKEGSLYLKDLLPHRQAMLYFTQPSTRTFLSFLSACNILGMRTSDIRDSSTSSERKGESLEDSLRTFSSYVDIIIMRSPIAGLCDRISHLLDQTPRPVPIVNAGSGPDQHPTQAILDVYTLVRSFREWGELENKTIMFVGDIKRGRTVRSLSKLLTHYKKIKMIFSSPKEFQMEDDLRGFLKNQNIDFMESDLFEKFLPDVDAVYMTRVQDEYDQGSESKKVDYTKYFLKHEHLKLMKINSLIMHPLPRRNELDLQIDHDPRAIYWRQERNGMWTRVALLTILMQVDHQILMPDFHHH